MLGAVKVKEGREGEKNGGIERMRKGRNKEGEKNLVDHANN